MLPLFHYSLDTISAGIEAYVELGVEKPNGEKQRVSYRTVVLGVTGDAVPAGFTLSGYLGGVQAPPLGPSHVFRWVERFSAGAQQWWQEIVAEAQAQISHALFPPSAPASIKAKGRNPQKRQNLANAWMVLWILRFLLCLLGQPTSSWPYALAHSRRRPRILDHTGWFAVQPRAPP